MRRTNIYKKGDLKPYSLSRSKIDLYFNCPRCFFLDRVHGVGQPPMFPYNLNSAIDTLFKKEFDIYREKGEASPLMKQFGVKAVPFKHSDLNKWRESDFGKGGIRYIHKETNLEINGAIDDLWINSEKQIHVIDYKSTCKDTEVSIDAKWQISYKRQVEIYQWLFRKNNFNVSDIAYFVYANADKNRDKFENVLKFDTKIIPYLGSTNKIEKILFEIKELLDTEYIPEKNKYCNYCQYREDAGMSLRDFAKK